MKKIFCAAALSLLFIHGASAQEIKEVAGGSVTVSALDMARTDKNLFVSMDLDVSRLKLSTNRELILTPVLVNGGDTLVLAPVMVAGRNRYFHHLRNGVVPEDADFFREGKVSVLEYRTSVPYLSWMDDSRLMLSGKTCGCCGESLSGGEDFLAYVELEPKVREVAEPYLYVPFFVYHQPEGEAVKIRMEKGSAYIDFPVNRTEIYEDYRDNASELQKIRSTVDLVRNDSDTRIIAIDIKGYASPEGSWKNNERLAKGRTETLRDYVRNYYDFDVSLMNTSYEPEDWEGLERFVTDSDIEDKYGILEIIRSGMEPDAKDSRIRTAYPKAYAFLLREVYPGLRHSDYTVRYEVRTYTDVNEIIQILKTRPQKLSLLEMYLAACEMEPGSAEYNEVFEIAARMYPEDATANLNAANSAMSRKDYVSAEKYLQKAGDSAEAVYARGVFAALHGEYEKAVDYMENAVLLGVENADEIIERINELKELGITKNN